MQCTLPESVSFLGNGEADIQNRLVDKPGKERVGTVREEH